MNDKDKANILKWIRGWKQAGHVMERDRRKRLGAVSVEQAIENLDDAFESTLLVSPRRHKSGLTDLQRWLARARQ